MGLNLYLTNLFLEGGSGIQNIYALLKNAASSGQKIGSLIVFVAGVLMVIAAVVFIAKGLMSQGRGQTNWALTIILLVVGGVFMSAGAGGWGVLRRSTDAAANTLNEWTTKSPDGNWEKQDYTDEGGDEAE